MKTRSLFLIATGAAALNLSTGCHVAKAPKASTAPALTLPRSNQASAVDTQLAKWDAKTKEKPSDDAAWISLGDAFMQKARETSEADYYNRAETAYQKALTLSPSKVAALDGMAWVTAERHEFDATEQWARKALALSPRDAVAYGLLGDADAERGRYEQALNNYQQMIDIRPDISSYSRGAHLLFLTGDMRKGVWLMNKAMASGGPYAENTAWCRAQISTMLFNMGALLPAEQVANDALKKSPHNYHTLMAVGRVRTARKDYTGAISAYQKAIEIAPQLEALVALGDLYTLTGKPEQAQQQFQLVEQSYQLGKSQGVQGDAAIALFYANHDKNLPEALELARAEYKVRPNVAVADTLAWCLYKNKLYAEARDYARKVLEHGTPDASYHFHAGMIAMACQDRVGAQKLLSKALSLNAHFHPRDARVAAEAFQKLGADATKGAHA